MGRGWRRLVGAVLALGLSACAEGDQPFAFLSGSSGQGVRSYEIFDGALRVRGPEGYCIDTRASRPRRGFVVLASCARAAGVGLAPDVDALLTVQVGEPGSALVTGREAEIARLLQAEGAGGIADGSELGGVTTAPGVVYAVYQGGGAPLEGMRSPYRRAIFDVGDRLVTVVLMRYPDVDVSAREAQALLAVTVAEMRAANRG